MQVAGIVFDFDGTLIDLDINWGEVTDDNRLEKELVAVEKIRLETYIIELLSWLYDSYILAIFSRNYTQTINKVLQNSGVSDILVVGRDSCEHIKPDICGLDMIAKKIGTDNLVMVGDSWQDVTAAKNYQIPSIVVNNKRLQVKPLGADFYIENLRQLLLVLES